MTQERTILEIAGQLQRDGAGPVYLQIAHLMRTKIAQGELVPGQLLPKQQRLATLLGVGQVTVRRALKELSDQGLVLSRQGSGTLVCDRRLDRVQRPTDAQPLNIVFSEAGDGYPFLSTVVDAIKQAAQIPPRLVHLGVAERSASLIEEQAHLHATRGLILNSPVNLTLVAACVRLGVPYVLLFNELIDGISPCLAVDYGPGLAGAIEHLLARQRRRIVLVTPEQDRFSAGRLSETFVTLLRAYGLPAQADTVIPAGYHQMQAHAATLRLLDRDEPPDGIIYSSDYQALGGLRAARDRGVRVPDELSIVGAGRLAIEGEQAALSTIDLNLIALAQRAVDTVLHRREPANRPLRQSVASAFVPGETS